MENPLEKSRSIPSLDGLRALSVLAVILGHSRAALLDRIPFNAAFRDGSKGVAVFFVISGFLITHLLLKELRRDETINLKRFYLRRTFRIFPPFYVFLIIVAVLGLLHEIQVTRTMLLIAATYTWNYARIPETWTLGHCWSLTLEEQFYLLWPLCMAKFKLRTNLGIAAAVILLSPLSRLITYYAWPSMRERIDMMLHTHLDTIMTGCLLALMLELKIWQRVTKLALSPIAPTVAIAFLFTVDIWAKQRLRGMYLLSVGISLENLAIATILLYVVFRHESPLGKFLNLKPIKHFGMISYSIYLYQQLFTGPYTRQFPLNMLFIVAAAELSYLLVEKPSFRIRDLVQNRIFSIGKSKPLQQV
ncbi:acyltransferase family protein [Granulicella sibirica]|uniref:Acyltransferase 3 n=1 Tax=Granulicella sibirica TaxID=2479048 RepID=A0A4Q0T450_9BACT|nr:acyltransferase [Granulicella sibirica]RXH58423.1 acyltransferase 3 [Granulicella sibirica]